MDKKKVVLKLTNVVKEFPGVKALKGVNFDLYQGEIHALIGANGAGKTTLVRIITRELKEDSGNIEFMNINLKKISVKEARQLGISMVEQDINLIPFFTVAENVMLGSFPTKAAIIDRKKLNGLAVKFLKKTGKDLDVKRKAYSLSPAEQVFVALARALAVNPKLLILDEPTARMGLSDVKILFTTLRRLKSEGVSIIYISHRLEEIYEIADRVTILRDGENVLTSEISSVSANEIVKAIIGERGVVTFIRKKETVLKEREEPVLVVRGLSGYKFRNIKLEIFPGEVVGLVGMVGAGKTELVNAIVGREKGLEGDVILDGKPITSPYKAVKFGMGVIPEKRKKEGIVGEATVCENISLPILSKIIRFGFINFLQERSYCKKAVEIFNIQTPSLTQKVKYLSGGNQQKVIVARWFLAGKKVLICDEASQGMDVGAKFEIYEFIRKFAKDGGAVLYSTSDIPEAVQVCDRIVVMHRGEIVKEYESTDDISLDEVVLYAMTGKGGQINAKEN
ncbi:MAG: sugar ABC transporter ATP-binding protein [Thermotogaceae bacterium]|nr:sugar ABC transporter ATP-binding protein [Thermotogaceae bacterium]